MKRYNRWYMNGYTRDQENFVLQKSKHFIGPGGFALHVMEATSDNDTAVCYLLGIYSR